MMGKWQLLSIDGRKEVHDHMETVPQRAGSYDLIVAEIPETC